MQLDDIESQPSNRIEISGETLALYLADIDSKPIGKVDLETLVKTLRTTDTPPMRY